MKKMAEKGKIRLKTTLMRKEMMRLMKVRQTNDQLLGKRKMSEIGSRKKIKQNSDDRDWAAGLPDHLLELIIERLPLVDCLSFRGVCKGWKRTTIELLKGSSRVVPLLVKPLQSGKETRTCLSVLDQTKKISTFDIPMQKEYIGSHIWGSYRDWLFLARASKKYVRITLRNPFSRKKVVLPNTCNDYHMVVLSSVPSDAKCIYMLVHRNLGVAFWTSGAPREWRKYELMGSYRVVDALYHEGHFYLLNDRCKLVIIDGKSVVKSMINTDEDNNESSIATQYLSLTVPCPAYTRKYIVESNGDILLLCRVFTESKKTRCFETYKLDISQMAWVKLERLGNDNQVIFLGKSCSRSFNTKEIVGGGGRDDALANKIYFSNNNFSYRTNEWDIMIQNSFDFYDADDWGVFDFNKGNSDRPRAFRAAAKQCAGIWVMAPILWCFRKMLLKRR